MAECRDLEDNIDLIQFGSEIVFDLTCKPCSNEGKNVEAQGYCSDCREHLCGECIRCHKKFALMKHHALVDKGSMPKKQDVLPSVDTCTEKCHTHSDEFIKFFCPTHEVLCCSVCVTLKHRLCEGIVYIPDVAKHIIKSLAFVDFQTKLKKLIATSEDMAEDAAKSLMISGKLTCKALNDIETFRKKINTVIDNLEMQMKKTAINSAQGNALNMNTVINNSDMAQRQLQYIATELETLQKNKQYCQMFIFIKKSDKKVLEIEDLLRQWHGKKISSFLFSPNEELHTLMSSADSLGEILQRDTNKLQVLPVADINISGSHYNRGEYFNITGGTLLSSDSLLVIDHGCGFVILIDTVKRKVKSRLEMKSWPWDGAAVSKTIVAVTLPYLQTIVFLTWGASMMSVTRRRIPVQGECKGITFHRNKLIVAFDKQRKVEIINITGGLLQKFETNGQGEPIFQDPTYVVVNASGQSIYVSDVGSNSLIKLDILGNVVAKYKDPELKRPGQVAVDKAGLLYVSDGSSRNVHLLTPACRKLKVLKEKSCMLRYPGFICYCETTDRLYIGTAYRCDCVVKVYQLS